MNELPSLEATIRKQFADYPLILKSLLSWLNLED